MKHLLVTAAGVGGAVALAAALMGSDGRPSAPETVPLALAGDGQATAYHAAAIHLPGGRVAEDAYLVVQDGRIAGVVGEDELPPLTPVVDFGHAHLAPGLVAASSTVTGFNGQADRSMAADAHALDSFSPFQDTTKVLERGITSYYLPANARRLIGGRGAVVKAAGDARVLVAEGDLMVNLTPEAWNPPDYFRPPMPPTADNPLLPAEKQAPNSRPGAMRALRMAMDEDAPSDRNTDGLAAWAATDAALRLRVDTADEAASALELAKSWGHRTILDGLSQAEPRQLARLLGTASSAVLFEVPLFASLPESASWEPPAPDLLAHLGEDTEVALRPGRYGRWTWLKEAASAAVAYGLDEQRAFQGITEVPARMLGVGDRVGSLRAGLDADFVVWNASPLDGAASVSAVYIDGAEVWNADAMPAAAMDDAVVVRGGTLWTGEGAPLSGGVEVLLADGKVVAAGRSVPRPAGARVVDAGPEAHLTPGFIDAGGRLGIGNASSVDPRADLLRLADGSLFSDQWLPVAQAGVTSMVLAPRGSTDGVRGALVKTADDGSRAPTRDRMVVFFDARTSDIASARGSWKRTLDGGKAYADKWVKWREAYAKWEKEQAEKGSGSRTEREKELRMRLAQGSAPVKEEVEEETEEEGVEIEEEEEEAAPADPLNGLWEGTIEYEMLPEPVDINVRFFHEGKDLTAILSSPDDPSGETLELEGTFEDNTVRIELPTEVGNVIIEGTISAPDTMDMRVELAGFGSVDFVMTRIEIDEGGAAPVARKKAKKDAGPPEPGTDWRREGLRALYEGRAVAVVSLDDMRQLDEVAKAFGDAGLPWLAQVEGGSLELLDGIRAAGVGVVLGPDVVVREDNRDLVPAAHYGAAGVPVVFRSNAAAGARFLPQLLTMATRYGLGAEDAMAGLTSRAADQLGFADHVGRLLPGLDGDLVVFSGHPFDLRSRVTRVFVDGHEVPQP